MNRREFFEGIAAAFVAANMPLPVEQLLAATDNEALAYLKRAQADLIYRITNPPCIMYEDGRIEIMNNPDWPVLTQYLDTLIKEYSA